MHNNAHPLPQRILLFDRHPIHRALIVGLLEAQNIEVEVCKEANQIHALITNARQPFDIFIVEMDASIARWMTHLKSQHNTRVPIIALVKDKNAQAKNANIAAVLKKPVEADELFAVLASIKAPSTSEMVPSAIDEQTLLERFGGKRHILDKMIALFLQESPTQLAALRKAIDQKTAEDIQKAAHAIKGSVSNFGADVAVETARKLEMMGRENDLADARQAYEHLELEIDRVKHTMHRMQQMPGG